MRAATPGITEEERARDVTCGGGEGLRRRGAPSEAVDWGTRGGVVRLSRARASQFVDAEGAGPGSACSFPWRWRDSAGNARVDTAGPEFRDPLILERGERARSALRPGLPVSIVQMTANRMSVWSPGGEIVVMAS